MDLIGDMVKPTWWITTLVSSVIIVWVADYLKNKAGTSLDFLSEKWASRTKKRREERLARVEHLASNPENWSHARFVIICAYVRTTLGLVLSLMMLVLGIFFHMLNGVDSLSYTEAAVGICLVMTFLALLNSFRMLLNAKNWNIELREARKLFKKN